MLREHDDDVDAPTHDDHDELHQHVSLFDVDDRHVGDYHDDVDHDPTGRSRSLHVERRLVQ